MYRAGGIFGTPVITGIFGILNRDSVITIVTKNTAYLTFIKAPSQCTVKHET